MFMGLSVGSGVGIKEGGGVPRAFGLTCMYMCFKILRVSFRIGDYFANPRNLVEGYAYKISKRD